MGNQPIPITQVIQVLNILESEQEPGEPTPVGGHGAGIAYLNQKHTFILAKVGKTTSNLPVNDLKQQLLDPAASSTEPKTPIKNQNRNYKANRKVELPPQKNFLHSY
ncbi:MAG TPA: hypothetical protein VJ249_10785 [Candidatus Bathyarchaeia archaeon]|nr:hypothetical protein [Candidatus Bathyarchaeia archaeon]